MPLGTTVAGRSSGVHLKATELGERVRQARMAAKLSQVALAEAIETTQSAVSLYESGSRHVCLEPLLRIAEVTRTPLAFFLGEAATGLHGGSDELVALVQELEQRPDLIPEVRRYVAFAAGESS